MMLLLDWRYLTLGQFLIIHHSASDPNYCDRWYDAYNHNNEILYETCLKVWPAYLATVIKLDNARERIIHIMENEIPAVIPNYKLKPLEPEPATTTYPTTTGKYYETFTMPELRRKKEIHSRSH